MNEEEKGLLRLEENHKEEKKKKKEQGHHHHNHHIEEEQGNHVKEKQKEHGNHIKEKEKEQGNENYKEIQSRNIEARLEAMENSLKNMEEILNKLLIMGKKANKGGGKAGMLMAGAADPALRGAIFEMPEFEELEAPLADDISSCCDIASCCRN